jgi:hypothetical protein
VLDAVDRSQAVVAAEKLEAEERSTGGEARERERGSLEQRLERTHPIAAEVSTDGIDVHATTLCSDPEGETSVKRAIEDDAQW